MTEQGSTIPQEEIAQLQKKFSEIKHSINNALAVMMALSEMSQRRPDYSEKLASTVLAKAPQIVSGLQEFTQALNEIAGTKPASEADYTPGSTVREGIEILPFTSQTFISNCGVNPYLPDVPVEQIGNSVQPVTI